MTEGEMWAQICIATCYKPEPSHGNTLQDKFKKLFKSNTFHFHVDNSGVFIRYILLYKPLARLTPVTRLRRRITDLNYMCDKEWEITDPSLRERYVVEDFSRHTDPLACDYEFYHICLEDMKGHGYE